MDNSYLPNVTYKQFFYPINNSVVNSSVANVVVKAYHGKADCFRDLGRSYCFPDAAFPYKNRTSYSRDLSRIKFLVRIHNSLSVSDVEKYILFLRGVLQTKTIVFDTKISKNSRFLLVDLKSTAVNKRGLILLYLTAFRYVQEFPEIINLLFAGNNNRDIRELFFDFQKSHFDYTKNCQRKVYDNLYGHGLINSYKYSTAIGYFEGSAISLDDFQKNLKNTSIERVQDFFIKYA